MSEVDDYSRRPNALGTGRTLALWPGFVFLLLVAWLGSTGLSIEPARDFEASLHWTVLANHGEHFDAELRLTNTGSGVLPASGWCIYFNSARLLELTEKTASVALRHVNGDFFELRPSERFEPLPPGTSQLIKFKGKYWAIKESDAPAGFYLVEVDEVGRLTRTPRPLKSTISPFVHPQQLARNPADKATVPTPASRFAENPPLAPITLSPRELVVPTPLSVDPQEGEVRIGSTTVVSYAPDLASTASFLVDHLHKDLGISVRKVEGSLAGPNVIRLQIVAGEQASDRRSLDHEAYSLEINNNTGIEVIGRSPAGLFYGVQSLRALLPVDAYALPAGAATVPALTLRDAPRFKYRGLHLDVARNFHSVETVKKLLDLMALYKLNRLHWHLTDDEGWRLEIKAYPELTAVGSRRGHTVDESDCLVPSLGSGPAAKVGESPGCGHYTQEEFVEVLRYASDRHIVVIPELDFPGHARAAIKSLQVRSERLRRGGDANGAERCRLTHPDDRSKYESVQMWRDNVVDVGLESTYEVVESVVDEIIGMYERAGAPLSAVHIGGDEVPDGAWQASPACDELLRTGVVKDLQRKTLHAYFFNRVTDLLGRRRLPVACWEECVLVEEKRDGKVLKHPDTSISRNNAIAYVWNNVWGWGNEDVAYRLANAGYEVVLCNATNLYFDLAYDKDPREPGYYWAGFVDERKPFEFVPFDCYQNARVDALGNPISPQAYAESARLTDAGKRRILGLQGQLWSECLPSRERLEYAAVPRLIALAERAWAAEPAWATASDETNRTSELEQDWRRFSNRLGQRELPRLDYLGGGVNYRIPPPGAKVVQGQMHANGAYPGFDIRYTLDGTVPTKRSALYAAPVKIRGEVKLKAFSRRGRSSSTTMVGQ